MELIWGLMSFKRSVQKSATRHNIRRKQFTDSQLRRIVTDVIVINNWVMAERDSNSEYFSKSCATHQGQVRLVDSTRNNTGH